MDASRKMDVDTAVNTPAPSVSAPLGAASVSSSYPAVLGDAQTTPFYPAGSSVVLCGLASRKDLENTIGTVIVTPSPADERVAIRLASGEQVRVKHVNVRPSIFPANMS